MRTGLSISTVASVPSNAQSSSFALSGGEGVETELRVVGLAPPAVAVLRPVVDEEEKSCGRQALDQAVQERLGLGVDPVEVLEDHEERLHLALAQQEALDARRASCWRRCGGSSACHCGVLDGHVEERQQRGQRGSSARSSVRSLPVTFSRISRASSRSSTLK